MSQPTRSTWDAGRFLQTLNFFEAIPLVSCIRKLVFGSSPPAPPVAPGDMLFDFRGTDASALEIWGALDDVVMGGVSASGIQGQADAAAFSGTVSTANSGGFASVRTRNFEPAMNLATYTGIELRVQGDGNRYKFLMRDETGWDSVAYSYSFDTVANQWITVRIPFAELTPVFRAKTVPDAGTINAAQIRSLQLMLSKFEYDGALNPHFSPGPFCLKIQTISAYQ